MTLHSKTLLSSTKPAEKPSTGCLQRSEATKKDQKKIRKNKHKKSIDKSKQTDQLNRESIDWLLIDWSIDWPLSCFWRRRLACDAAMEEVKIGGNEGGFQMSFWVSEINQGKRLSFYLYTTTEEWQEPFGLFGSPYLYLSLPYHSHKLWGE